MFCPRLSFLGDRLWNRFLQQLGVWMERLVQDILNWSRFNDKTAQHDPDAVADVVSRRQIMRDVNDTYFLFISKRAEQVNDFHA